MSEQTYAAPPTGDPTIVKAGFWQRFGASLIDGILLSVVNFALSVALSNGAGFILSLLIGVGYYGYLEGIRTQTLGKSALGIRVVSADGGGAIGFGAAVGRYFGRILSTIPIFLGYFWMLWDDEKQTWHDKLAGSYVVTAPRG